MRVFIRACAIAAALAPLAPVWSQDKTDGAQPSEIVVQGIRDQDRQISKFVDALADAPVGGQLSRFEEKLVCPAAVGLAPVQNKAVAARMRSVAISAGIPVDKEDCSPNVFVVVAQDKKAMIKKLRENWADPLGNRVQVPDQPGPATVLHLEGRLDADGVPVGVKGEEGDGRSNYYGVESSGNSSRIRPASRPHFLASVLVVEPDALAGLTTMQLADYSAMRLFARTDPSRLGKSAAPTILTALEAPMGSAVPISLTQWDFGFLKALYGSGEGRFANQQRTEMRRMLSRELEQQQKSARE